MSNDKVYAGNINLDVSNNSHTKMIERILEDGGGHGKRILDIGCSRGYLGQALKEFEFEVWGIEPSQAAADIATTRIDRVFCCSLEEFFYLHAPQAGLFDYLVFGDVLEHLTDPEGILRKCRNLLTPSGALIASIPNIAHVAARLMLLQGRWDYADFGLLDQTHLHFYTRSTVVHLFTQSGYRIESLDRVQIPAENTGIDVPPALLTWARTFINDSDSTTFQFVVVGRNRAVDISQQDIDPNTRFSAQNPVRILVLVPYFELGLANIRMVQPLGAWMRRYGGQVQCMKFADLQMSDLKGVNVVVIQRVVSALTLKLIRRIQDRGIKIIFDLDDLLTEIPAYLSSSSALRSQKPMLEKILRKVDAVTVATPRLGERLAKYNTCHLVPNCPAPLLAPAVRKIAGDHITLLMASSDTVRFDFIAPALKKLIENFPGRLQLVAIGPPGAYLASQGIAVKQLATMDYYSFRRFIASQTDAIGIIPLDETTFGACKSAIKFMDYALAGIPSVCSSVPPYSDVVQHDGNGLLTANDSESWYTAMARMCDSAELRYTLAENARQHVQKHWSLGHAANAWQAVISALPIAQESNLPIARQRPSLLSRSAHYWRRFHALLWAIDMEGGLFMFIRRMLHLWRTEGMIGLGRRLGAFRSREL